MTATLYLEEPIPDERSSIDCEDARVLGNVVWATPEDEDREIVVPLDNIRGIEGDEVEQYVEDLESPGGMYTELVTDVE